MSSDPPSFPNHARAVVRSVRGSFTDLLVAAKADPQSPQSISRRLGLNKNLAWKISKIVQDDDPTVVLEHMPGAAGLDIFLGKAEAAEVGPDLLKTARDAVQEYERLIRVHSGDRATLEMMGTGLSPAGRQQRDEHHRKLLFQGSSYVWGVQARVIVKVFVVFPAEEPGTLAFASVSGLVDFRRLRPDVSWAMATRWWNNDDGTPMDTPPAEALDPDFAGAGHAPLMGAFCSQPIPELRRVVEGGRTSFELVEGPVGNTGALTCVVGTMQRGIPFYRTPENEWGEHIAMCDIPAELLVLDSFIHESFAFAIPPEANLYGTLGVAANTPHPRQRLPLSEPLQDLGVGPLPLPTPEVPRHGQLVQAIFDRIGRSPGEFRGYRMKINYPACPAALALRYRLPAAPEAEASGAEEGVAVSA